MFYAISRRLLWFTLQTANESAMEEDLGLVGASAEDTEAELIRKICETELLAGMKTNLFSDVFYSPLFKNCVVDVVK